MSRTKNDANTTNELATLLIVEFTTRFCSVSLHLLIYILIGSLISIQVKIMPRSNKKKSGAKKSTKSKTKRHTKGGKSERDNSTREQPKRSCTNNQTLLSRSGPDNVSVRVRLASAEDKEVNFGSITSADDEKKNGNLDLSPQLREMSRMMTLLNQLNVMMMLNCHSISMTIWKN